MEDENVASNPSSPQGRTELVDEIIDIVEAVKDIGEYRRTQRKECDNLIRRLKVFLPLLDEIRDLSSPIPEAGIECLKKLKKAFQSAKSLLHMCHCGSKIYLATESEAMMVRFHSVYDKINQAFEGMPYEKLGISEEAEEQIELLSVQMKRAKKRTDTQDMELAMDLMVALSTNDDRNADSATIERLANKLGLHTAEELEIETQAIKKIKETRCGPRVENMQHIIYLLNKFKRLAGVPEDDLNENDSQEPKPLVKTSSATIPNEFLCPITLEIMKDPVIIVTGQTYERKSIEQWFDAGHKTCPKTGQSLSNLSIAPNFALKNLILQWCEKNNFELQQETDQTEEGPSTSHDNGSISAWVQNLSSSKLDEQRAAVKKIRLLSKENPENRVLIAKSGGIPPLVHLLSYPDSRIQEHAVTALLNLSIDESNKKLISREEPIPAIIEVLQKGSVGAKENSAAALFSLSMLDENKEKIGQLNGIPPLIELLKTGTIRGKKDAVTALFNLCLNHANKTRAIDAGIVSPLLKVVEDRKLDLVDETLSILLILASNPKGKQELGKLSFIETLVNFMKDGTPKNKECATSVLLELGSNNTNLILAALQYGVYEHLVEISQNCTERGQRKAKSILQLMSRAQQIP